MAYIKECRADRQVQGANQILNMKKHIVYLVVAVKICGKYYENSCTAYFYKK